jgi:pimeloyl-ACP methyl ester carboxylesterase
METGPVDIAFDVTTESARARIAGWMFAPASTGLSNQTRVFVCVPGGSYTKSYFHLEVPGHKGYSMAQYLAAKGHIVIAIDPLGVGESTHPESEGDLLATHIAAASDAAVRQALTSLREGTLLPHLGRLPCIPSVAVGHSMGGMLVTLQQANYGTFNGLAILGFPTLELDRGTMAVTVGAMIGGEHPTDLTALGASFPVQRERLRDLFHFPDVPAEVIAVDNSLAVPVLTDAALHTMNPGLIVDKTNSLDIPLFLGFGEIDLAADFRREPASYLHATDITVLQLPKSGHCSNFASTRHQLWDRLDSWARSISP